MGWDDTVNRGTELKRCAICGKGFVHHFYRLCEDCRIDSNQESVYKPTPEEIATECENIRAGKVPGIPAWDTNTKCRRAGANAPQPYKAPRLNRDRHTNNKPMED